MASKWIAAGSLGLVTLLLTGLWVRDALVRWRLEGSTQNGRRFATANAQLSDASDRKRIVFIGDSRIARWQPPPEIAGYDLIFRGIGGESAIQMRRRYVQDSISLGPRIIFIQTGINDLVAASYLGRTERDEVVRELQAVFRSYVDDVRDVGICLLIGTIIQPAVPRLPRSLVWRDNVRDAVARVNEFLKEQSSTANIVDLNQVLHVEGGILPPRFAVDELHLNAAAYSKINSALVTAIDHCDIKTFGR